MRAVVDCILAGEVCEVLFEHNDQTLLEGELKPTLLVSTATTYDWWHEQKEPSADTCIYRSVIAIERRCDQCVCYNEKNMMV